MPHEVIMPALGMAQDTGLIVSWLKKTGDVIKAGDALMEVETDKAVMEVEALADGVLTDIRAVAGDAVPVGSVIAVIASADGETLQVGSRPALAPDLPVPDASGPDATTAVPASKPAGQSIIMPALGMAQETGRLISWLKSPGDAVTADEILLEVETDKSTMEVPAGHDGFVAALLAEAGQEIPVGDVIAVITKTKPEAATQQRAVERTPSPAPLSAVVTPGLPAKMPVAAATGKMSVAAATGKMSVAAANGRILASPKARRLALEQGLHLNVLVENGYSQPFHVSDLEVLRGLSTVAPAAVVASAEQCRLTARAGIAPTADIIAWSNETVGITLASRSLWASFASAAMRGATGQADADVVIELASAGEPVRRLSNPDHAELSGQPEVGADVHPSLVLRDLTQSAIIGMRLPAVSIPTLGLVREGDFYTVTLDFSSDYLSEDVAILLITGFAGRLAEPLRHLL
jgi:pyruvate/2-oxoglutarate dehydrogenase complex dihydrolipoamide acyltransferase (E2) component